MPSYGPEEDDPTQRLFTLGGQFDTVLTPPEEVDGLNIQAVR